MLRYFNRMEVFGLSYPGLRFGGVNMADIKEIEDEIREIINWIKVFETEYKLPAEVVDQLRGRLESIASKISS